MKKIVKVILPLMLILSFFVSAIQPEASSKFKDTQNHWAEKEIGYLSSKGIINGFLDGTFKPNITVTKAQAAIMIAQALKLDLNNRPNPKFADVGTNHTAYKAIAALTDEGIYYKTPKFYPNHVLVRHEMARILVTAYSLKGAGTSTFKDIPSSAYNYEDIDALAYHNITQGYPDGTFRQHESVTRAQFSVFLSKTLDVKSPAATEKIKEGSIALNKKNISILEGSEEKLIIKRVDYPDKEISTDKHQIKWFSENTNIATVDSNGNVRGVFPGTTKVGVIVDGIKVFCTVKVKPVQVSSIDIPSKITITEGQEQEIVVKIVPEKAHDYKIIWSSSNDDIVSIDANGKIKALKKGTAKIKAVISGSNTIYSEAEVTVQEKVLTLEEVFNADGVIYEKYLNQNYNSLPTPLGDWKPKIKVKKTGNNIYIEVDWYSLNVTPYTLKYSDPSAELEKYGRVLSEQDRLETKQLLRNYMRKIADDTFKAFPGYYVQGKFYTGGYKYPNLQVGWWSTSFLTWDNIDGEQISSKLRWKPKYDDYNFALDYDLREVKFMHPQEGKLYSSKDYIKKPIQLKVGEKIQLELKVYPEQLDNNLSYREMGFDLRNQAYFNNIKIDENGGITGLRIGEDSIFVYNNIYSGLSMLIPVQVIE